jgi:hypothetical protein
VFKVEHNLTDPAEYPYGKQYENRLNKVQTRSLLPTENKMDDKQYSHR